MKQKRFFPYMPGNRIYKVLVCLGTLLLTSAESWSQQENDVMENHQQTTPLHWGIKGGLNVSSLNVDTDGGNSAETGSVVGGVAGVTVGYSFNPKWSIHSGLEASMKGFELDINANTKFEVKAVYLQIPVEVGYKINLGKTWYLEPRLGLYVAYGIGGKSKMSSSSTKYGTFSDKLLKKADYGVGLGVYFGKDRFIVGLHGEAGLAEINGDNFTVSGGTVHNSNFAITVGYLF